MKIVSGLIAVAIVFMGACSRQAPVSAETRFIKSLEASLVLPGKSEQLRRYDRKYAITPTHVKGILLFNGAELGKVEIVPPSHLHMERRDGGCEAIQAVYDRTQKRWTNVICNGSA